MYRFTPSAKRGGLDVHDTELGAPDDWIFTLSAGGTRAKQ
jgi:hypothetical protein